MGHSARAVDMPEKDDTHDTQHSQCSSGVGLRAIHISRASSAKTPDGS
jgi:hypothetical protein